MSFLARMGSTGNLFGASGKRATVSRLSRPLNQSPTHAGLSRGRTRAATAATARGEPSVISVGTFQEFASSDFSKDYATIVPSE